MAKVYFQKLKIISHSNHFILCFLIFVCSLTLVRNRIGVNSVYTLEDHQVVGVVKKIKRTETSMVLEIKAKEKIQVLFSSKISLNIGDTILVEGNFKRPDTNRMKHLFNYRNYLKSRKIFWIVEAKNIQIVKYSTKWFDKLKNIFYRSLETRKEAAYYKTFLVGDQSGLSDTYKRRIRKLGISHLFALSGMHLSVLSLFLIKLFSYFKWSEKKKQIIILFLLEIYVLFTVMSPSILRAFFFLFLCMMNKRYQLKYTPLQLFFYLCGVFLLINPFMIYSTSFLYSFVVSFFLLYFKNFIKEKHSIFRLSVIATLASAPITLATSFELNLCSIILNIILSPVISMIIFPLCILSFLFPILEPIFGICLFGFEQISMGMEMYCCWMVNFKSLPVILYVLYFILLFLCFASFQRQNKMYGYVLLVVILFHYFIPYMDPKTKVVFLDVGQGDSSLISFAHHTGNILIDTGGSLNHKRCLNEIIPYLKSEGITSLNALILTHGDYDHMGEAINLVENFKVEKVIFNCGGFNELEQDLIKVLDKKKISYYSCIKELNIDDNKLYFLNNGDYGNENDNSSVIYTQLNNYKFLFMGDAGVEKEKDILDKYNISDIDLLKVGHHGSKTSSSKKFINEINPNYSIISVGKNNRYGHPNDSVLENLEDSKIYRTDQNGSIMFKIKKSKLEIETCAP